MIRELQVDDVEAYVELRRRALAESPLAFAASPADDFVSSADAVREHLRRVPECVILGAYQPDLVGAIGLFRDRHVKASHKVHLWGMYVVPDHRRQGVGGQLLREALRRAKALAGVSWVHLSVTSAAPEARRLYERAGFHVWGTEPHALCHGGQAVAEHHLSFRLEP